MLIILDLAFIITFGVIAVIFSLPGAAAIAFASAVIIIAGIICDRLP